MAQILTLVGHPISDHWNQENLNGLCGFMEWTTEHSNSETVVC